MSVQFRLLINCDSAAFGTKPELHLADILRGIANTVQYVGTAIDVEKNIKTPVFDVNGIRCGTWSLERKEQKKGENERSS